MSQCHDAYDPAEITDASRHTPAVTLPSEPSQCHDSYPDADEEASIPADTQPEGATLVPA